MRIGVSLRSGYGPGDLQVHARHAVERARAAAAAGLDSLFVGDHHGVPGYLQNSPLLGRLLAEWDGRTCGALYLLPLWPPRLVAEQVGTLAALAEGPFVMQCAVGAGDHQFAAMGADIHQRARAFEEGLAAVREHNPGVGVWIGGHAERAIARAARLGDAWLCGPEATLDEARTMLDRYHHHGGRHAVIRRDIHVGADDADARRVADPVLARGYRGFDPQVCVVGGTDAVAEQLSAFGALGFAEVLVRHLADGQDDVVASFARLHGVRESVSTT